MSKTRGSKLPWEARAAEVLAGRLKVDAVELIALVNEVNPTGRGRDERESTARYAQKARLVSLLVARFPDAIDVSPEPGHEGVVSLRHRTHRQAACHAVLDALDDDARSWAQRRIDLGGVDSDAEPSMLHPTAPESDDEAPDDLHPDAVLGAAVHAEEAFDFERADRLYRRAFAEHRDTRTAQALLRFLVDAMAADADALAVGDALPAAVRAHPGVRVLLGLAAARTGDHERAVAFASHVGEPRAAEVLAIVARGALARGDTAAAARSLAEAEAADPACPDLRPIAEELAKAREAERAPIEAELARLVAGGHDVEASAQADAILARWPESEAARRAQRTLDARRRTDEGRRLMTEADAARARGEHATASALYHRALAAPLPDDARARAQRAVADMASEERARRNLALAERTVAALAEPDLASGLAAYVELDDEVRRTVRARAGVDALGWIDAMTGAGIRPRGALEAAVALRHALSIEGADPAAALALIAPHERAIGAVPAARAFEERARRRIAEEHRRHAAEALGAAEEARRAGDAERCRRHVERAGRDLDGELRARAESVWAWLAAHAERRKLEKHFDRARGSHDYTGARRDAGALAAGPPGPEQARWAEVLRTFDADVRRERRVRVFDVDEGAACSRALNLSTYPPMVHACIDLDRGLAVVPAAAGADVFVRCFSLETRRLVRCIHLVSPERVDEPSIQLSGSSALVTGGGNGVLEVSLETGQPLRWKSLLDASNLERRFEVALQPVPGGRYLWVMYDDNGLHTGGVHDIEGERPIREITGATSFQLMPGVRPPRMAAIRGNAASLHEPAGNQSARYDIPDAEVEEEEKDRLEAVVPHPLHDGICAVFWPPRVYPNPPPPVWAELSAHGELLRTGPIEGAAPYVAPKVACARDVGMVFIGFRMDDKDNELLALVRDPAGAPGAGSLRVAYRISLGPRRILAQDPEGRRVFILGEHDDGVEIVPLGPEPPVLADRPDHAFKPPLRQLSECVQPTWPKLFWALDLYRDHFKWATVPEIRKRTLALRAEHEGDRLELLRLFWALGWSEASDVAGELGEWLSARYPDDPDAQQTLWAGLVVRRRWAELVALLDPMDPPALPEGAAKHRHHLLAAARIATGDMAAAVRHLDEADALPGKCDVAPLRALSEAILAPQPEGDVPLDLPPLQQLVAVIRAADALLARGDHEGVIALSERVVVWEHREVQAFARLATAHLARPATTEAERLRKSLALAIFADVPYDPRVGVRCELLVPGAIWPGERIDDLAARARAWLADAKG